MDFSLLESIIHHEQVRVCASVQRICITSDELNTHAMSYYYFFKQKPLQILTKRLQTWKSNVQLCEKRPNSIILIFGRHRGTKFRQTLGQRF